MNTPQQLENHKSLMEVAKELDIGLVHIFNPDVKGGLTVAFKAVNDYKSTRMVECAVQTCSVHDFFNRKIGAAGAIQRFLNEETITLPILTIYCQDHLAFAVKNAFTGLYSNIAPT